ncbi:MAG TPA: phosphoglycerate kinase [Candidatus Pacearchaeota archaeon]|nr:phosphoglycerate kinase [Candidatus Pacearchaeota archaeon]
MINSLDKINLKQKKVILQLDFEESFSSYRATIKKLIEEEARILVIGTLAGEVSLAPWAEELGQITGRPVDFLAHSIFEKSLPDQVERSFSQNQVVLLENLAIYPEERQGEPVLAQALSRLGQVYVNEAFGLTYLSYASINHLPNLLESAGGVGLIKEYEAGIYLSKRPLTAIIGGDKIFESLELVLAFLEKGDHVLISGKMAEAIFRVKGISPGKDWPEEESVKLINRLDITDTKLHLPVDVVTGPKGLDDSYRRVFAPGEVRKEDDVYDIGPETIRLFSEIIAQSPALVWRGPLGLYTWPEFSRGTKEIAEAIANQPDIFSVVGGQETVAFLKKMGLLNEFSHVSTGGESIMRLAAGRDLPGLKALSTSKLIN